MPIRLMVGYQDPRLRALCTPADPTSPDIRQAVADLWDTLATQRGVAIAAPQIGLPVRLFVWNLKRARESGGPPTRGVLVNPVLIERKGSVPVIEGCLSFPGLDLSIRRPEWVTVSGFSEKGEPVAYSGSGLFARMIEHEMDHLDGVLLPDRQPALSRVLSFIRRRRWEKKMEESR